jgi:plastin-1
MAQLISAKQVNVVKGSTEDIKHSFSDAEKYNFVDFINQALHEDPDLQSVLPLDPNTNAVFEASKDGVLMCKLINRCVPDTIDPRTLNTKAGKNVFHVNENQNLVINSARAIGCQVVNIRSSDLIEAKPHLVLGLMWQIIKIGLYQNISLKENPNLIRLLQEGEDLHAFMKLPPDQILLRWFNYHLARAGWNRRVTNFSSDIQDSENYTVLLSQIAPQYCDRAPLNIFDQHERAEAMLQNAKKIDCRKFVRPKDVVDGTVKLNLAFTANLFNTCPALDPPEAQVLDGIDWKTLYGDESDSREERTFRIWINSLGIRPEVNNLFEDVRDGLVLLKVLDTIKPGIVSWDKVNKQPTNKFKKAENCNYAVVLGKQLKFSLVGVAGSDIVDGNRKLTLALIWQAMRYYVLNFLSSMSVGGREITDADIIKWATTKVSAAGKQSTISSFRDKSLSTSIFLIDLLSACQPQSVDYQYIKPGSDDHEKEDNAKYAIGCARKMGCQVFCLWEDLVEVKDKMIMTFMASVMQRFGGSEGKIPASPLPASADA